ncbi:neural cell adhesion molecule 1, partial [Biomphalaria pfeifferi]
MPEKSNWHLAVTLDTVNMQAQTFLLVQCVLIMKDIVSSQISNYSASVENDNVKLTFVVPVNVREEIIMITFGRDPRQNVLFIYNSDFKAKTVVTYIHRLTTAIFVSERKVVALLTGVQAGDAGLYECWDGTGPAASELTLCRQKLIVVRKPGQPSIVAITDALEGQTLKLSCNTISTSLPADHGLPMSIFWHDEQKNPLGIPAGEKYVVNAEGQLEIHKLESSDMGRQVTCTSSDRAEGVATPPGSDPSPPYEIHTESPPSLAKIPGLTLEHEYFRDFSLKDSFKFAFVINSLFEPSVVAVKSRRTTGQVRNEDLTSDVSITKSTKYEGKIYLTKFTFTLLRAMYENDKNRTFILTINNRKFSRDFMFILRDVGPPSPVTNISALDITHDTVVLIWTPGSEGGFKQVFDVEYRCLGHTQCNSTWTTGVRGVPESDTIDTRTKATVENLSPETEYNFRIVSTNTHGSATSEPFYVKTTKMTATLQETEMKNGVIIGIAVAFVAIVFIAAILYVTAYKGGVATTTVFNPSKEKKGKMQTIKSLFTSSYDTAEE